MNKFKIPMVEIRTFTFECEAEHLGEAYAKAKKFKKNVADENEPEKDCNVNHYELIEASFSTLQNLKDGDLTETEKDFVDYMSDYEEDLIEEVLTKDYSELWHSLSEEEEE